MRRWLCDCDCHLPGPGSGTLVITGARTVKNGLKCTCSCVLRGTSIRVVMQRD